MPIEAIDYACPSCKLPIFSWDHLPVFFHSSQHKTNADGSFTEDALNIITKFPIVTIEKWQGDQAPTFTWEFDAMVASATKIKQINPNISVIVWFDSVRIYCNKSLNPDAKGPCTTGHFKPAYFLEKNHKYLLKNKTGQPALEPWSGCHIYNFQEKSVRDYWMNMCLNITKSGVIDGCGADASWQADPSGGTLSADTAAKWEAGHRQMMKDTTASLGNGLLLGKDSWELGDYVNGVLHEGCDASNKTINLLRNLTLVSQKQGRPLVYECHAGCKGADCLDSIASFLIGAGPYHFFGLGGWSGNSFSDHWIPQFFEPSLGKPKADAAYNSVSDVWTRHFESGTRVTFNAKNKTGTISWSHATTTI